MKKKNIVFTVCGVILASFMVTGFYFLYQENQDLKGQVVALNTQLKTSSSFFAQELITVNEKLDKKAEQISVLEEAVDPKDKRFARIKQVRAVIQRTAGKNPHNLNILQLTDLAASVIDYSQEYDVPVPLILAVMRRESAFNPQAVSHAGAEGLMQLMPATAQECANDIQKRYYNVRKVRDNIQLGTWYLWKMMYRFKNNLDLAVRAYNCGPTCVEKVTAGEITDYPSETKQYVEIVLRWKKEYENMGL